MTEENEELKETDLTPYGFLKFQFKVFGKIDDVSENEIFKELFYTFEAGP